RAGQHGEGRRQQGEQDHLGGQLGVHEPLPAEFRAGLPQRGDLPQDQQQPDGQHQGDRGGEPVPREQLGLDDEDLLHASFFPVSARKASSSDACSIRRSLGTIRSSASARVMAGARLPVPVTTTWPPVRLTSVTSGRDVSRESATGEDGRNRTVCVPPTRATSPAGESMAATRPESISAIRSQSRSASSMKWVTSTIVTPESRTGSISSQVSRRACGSSPVVSSSSTAMRGLPTRASATESRWRWPPESLPNAVSRLASRPTRSISSRQSAGSG